MYVCVLTCSVIILCVACVKSNADLISGCLCCRRKSESEPRDPQGAKDEALETERFAESFKSSLMTRSRKAKVQGGSEFADQFTDVSNLEKLLKSINFEKQSKCGDMVFNLPSQPTSKPQKLLQTTCEFYPDRIECNFGRFKYIINEEKSEEVFNDQSLEKFVGMVHRRIQEGDELFDMSLIPRTWVPSVVERISLTDLAEVSVPYEEAEKPPVIVVCDRVKPSNSSSDQSTHERRYKCRWVTMGLKRKRQIRNNKLPFQFASLYAIVQISKDEVTASVPQIDLMRTLRAKRKSEQEEEESGRKQGLQGLRDESNFRSPGITGRLVSAPLVNGDDNNTDAEVLQVSKRLFGLVKRSVPDSTKQPPPFGTFDIDSVTEFNGIPRCVWEPCDINGVVREQRGLPLPTTKGASSDKMPTRTK